MNGLINGVIFGALAAFLFDPISGSRRRALIRDKAIKYRNRAEGLGDKFMRDKANRFEGLKNETRKLVDKGKVMIEQKRQEFTGDRDPEMGADMSDIGGIAPSM